jgi:hypothetical protein
MGCGASKDPKVAVGDSSSNKNRAYDNSSSNKSNKNSNNNRNGFKEVNLKYNLNEPVDTSSMRSYRKISLNRKL